MHRLSSLMPSKMSLSQITTLYILFGLTVLLTTVSAGEWQTTGGQLCIDKCEKHDDVYPFYWCHVSDPSQVYSDGDKLSWWGHDDGNNPGTKLKWDYCVPSDLENDRAVDRYVFYWWNYSNNIHRPVDGVEYLKKLSLKFSIYKYLYFGNLSSLKQKNIVKSHVDKNTTPQNIPTKCNDYLHE